ncbi:carbohydrate kinase family protein [Patescibacteria group bacterium]
MYDVISIGHATQDVYLVSKKFKIIRDKRFITGQAECFAFGTKVELDDILFEIGGGATNTAVTFARQGLKTAVISKIGSDTVGNEIVKTMNNYNISTQYIKKDRKMRSGFSTIFLTASGERTILVYRGASHNFKASDIPWTKLKTKWIYVSSLAGNITVLKKIIQFAKKKQIHVALNPGGLELKRGLKILRPIIRDVAVLLLNRAEGARLLGVPYSNERGIVRGLDTVCNGIAVVTESDKGSWVCDGLSVRKIKITPVKALDTTGAGDAYGSGFVAGIIKRPNDFSYALRLASINAASVVQQVGAKNGLVSRRLPKGKRWMKIHVKKV